MLRARGSLLLLLFLAGCSAPQADPQATVSPSAAPSPSPVDVVEKPAAGDTNVAMTWDGKPRNYIVHAPPGYDGSKPLPVVFVLHFYPGSGLEVAKTSAMSVKADKENFLAVYPDGFVGGFNALICCGSEDDVGFIGAIAERMKTVWKADPKRFYSTGISNGADMSLRIAVELPGVFAAVAPVSGGFGGDKSRDPTYKPKSPVSVISFLGEQDSQFAAIAGGLDRWREFNSCKAGKPVGMRTTSTCSDGSVVVAYRIPAMGHRWPGGGRAAASPPHEGSGPLVDGQVGLDATSLIWDFFKAHPRS